MFRSFLYLSFALALARTLTYPREEVCYKVHTYPKGNHLISHRLEICDKMCELCFPTSDEEKVFRAIARDNYTCPDLSVEVVVFAPNNIEIEQNVTLKVYRAALNLSYSSVKLLIENATTTSFLSYARCPKLKALFYDGDADPSAITTYDGLVTYVDMQSVMWNYTVISYWLACQAYNPPMLISMTQVAPRRWAAGRNNLEVGPSDNAAAEAMIDALKGRPLEESFNNAKKKWDVDADHWGFGGFGED